MKMHILAETLIQISSPDYSDDLGETIGDILDHIDFAGIVKQKLSEKIDDLEVLEKLEVKAV